MQDNRAKVKVSMWARITSYLPVINQKNNISGLLSNMKSYFSDKTAKDWAFEFFFLAIELGLATVLGVLVHAIAAMAGVGLFVSYGLTAVACALGLYYGRSMTQPMKEHRAGNKQKAKRAIELEEQYNAVCMHDECSRISEDLLREMNIWMMDKTNLDKQKNVADVYEKVKALMQKQESAFSKLPKADQEALKSKVDWFFKSQSRYYAQYLIDLWKSGFPVDSIDGFPVDSIEQSLNEKGMPQGWSRLNVFFNIYLSKEEKILSEKTAQDAAENGPYAADQKDQGRDGPLSKVKETIQSEKTAQGDRVNGKEEAPSEATQTTTEQDETSVLFHKDAENGPYAADQKDQGNDESLSDMEEEIQSEKTAQGDEQLRVNGEEEALSGATQTTTAQDGTNVLPHKGAENGPYAADQKVQGNDGSLSKVQKKGRSKKTSQDAKKLSEQSKKTALSTTTAQDGTSLLHEDANGLGFFNLQNGTGSHNNEAKLDAVPSSAADGLTNGGFYPTIP